MNMRKLLVAVVIAAGAVGAWALYPTAPATQQAPSAQKGKKGQAILVVTAPVRVSEVQTTFEALGTTNANEAITITSKVTGTVQKINFIEGQIVPKGHALVEIDSREMRATLAAAVADEATARANYERAAQLLTSGSAPKATVQTLLSTLEATQARAEAARARLAEFTITAPFSGRLGLRRLSAGALVSAGTIITTLDDLSVIKVDFSVPETLLSRIKAGAKVTASSDAYSARTFEGVTRTVDSRVDPQTRAVEVRAEIPNPDGTLQAGMLLTVTLTLETRKAALLIPEEALVPEGEAQFVFVNDNGRASKRKVVIGERQRGSVEVREGLSPNDSIVVGGVQRLRDGVAVRETRGSAPLPNS
jgi:membrane fusion protein (multidrug efflux system)